MKTNSLSFEEAEELLMKQIGIRDEVTVGCFLCNWGDRYICGSFNNSGCKRLEACQRMAKVLMEEKAMTSNWQDKMLATFGGPRAGRSKVSEVQTMDSNTNGNEVVESGVWESPIESGVWESPIKVTEKPEIVVHGTVNMPYFEIKYHEVGKKYYNVGFSSYDLENCFRWLEEEFEVVEVNSDGIASTVDVVREPEHYKHGIFEVIDEMMIAFGPEAVYHFCICNAWKYKNRAPYKGNFEEDMKKADWYLTKAKEIKGGKLWQE